MCTGGVEERRSWRGCTSTIGSCATRGGGFDSSCIHEGGEYGNVQGARGSDEGNVDMVAEKIKQDIEDMGHREEVTLKSDQEPALLDLVNAIGRVRGGVTHKEKAKARDSQSNGVAERAVQSVEGMVRTMKIDLEEKLGTQVPCAHPIMSWMVEHAAETLNRYLVGEDGKTAYERLRGKKSRRHV